MSPSILIAHDAYKDYEQLPYDQLWCVDFEFYGKDGDTPVPVCMVAKELRSKHLIRLWQNELETLSEAPFPVDENSLFVAYYASAEINCFLALGWNTPLHVLDLFAEFRVATNGLQTISGASLLGALVHFDIAAMTADTKETMRDLILAGGPWSSEERKAILDYCQEDVDVLPNLLTAILRSSSYSIDKLNQALLRGRYMRAVAQMEFTGVPIDTKTFCALKSNWDAIRYDLIEKIDADYGVYDNGTFKLADFENWLVSNEIPWPRLASGKLATDDDTFRQMARAFPTVAPLHELRHSLSKLKLNNLQVGTDRRNRCMLSAFRSKTGRNQPSNAKFIFGPSRWLRSLIKPSEGHGIAYLDFGSQEIAIAAALSGDKSMQEAYLSGDPYMTFAIQAGLAPAHATKASHKDIRNRCKAIVLGVGYGMGAESMAQRSGLYVAEARELLRRHKETYHVFWGWAENNVNIALAGGTLQTAFGWPIKLGAGIKANDRSLLNFPMQANGAEMLRLAACMATEAGLKICAPIHDALLLEAPLDVLDDQVTQLKSIMEEASRIILIDITCRVDADIVRYPERYQDEAGGEMWDRVMGILAIKMKDKPL